MNDEHDRGLAHDFSTLLNRRGMLGLLGGAVLLGAVGCSSDTTSPPPNTATPSTTGGAQTSTGAAQTSTAEIPDETAGPFPGDGSNGPDALAQSGIVRSDIRSSFGTSTTTAQGVPLKIELTVTDNGTPLKGAGIYIWHCDREGRYSMYSEGVTDENYLRGVQEADASGKVAFTSIFPAAYPGRWPHVHFEVYATLAETTKGDPVKTTQLAFPEDACKAIYATTGYEQSVANLARTPLESDGIFQDGHTTQLATMTGTPTTGYTATLAVNL